MDLARDFLAEGTSSFGRALCEAYTDRVDEFVADVFRRAAGARDDVCLVAIGGYGRRELSLQSDLDLLLVHDRAADVAELAQAIWYPLWDTGAKVGHAVRTRREALALAADDLDTATALLSVRPVAGNAALAQALSSDAAEQWRRNGDRYLAAMATRVRQRHRSAGEVAFMLEPDLKEGRGGLRDVQSMRWAEAAGARLWDGDAAVVDEAYAVVLDARVELHRRTGRAGNMLVLQEQDAVAGALGYGDADELMRAISTAARTIAFRSDHLWRRVETAARGPLRRIFRQDRVLGPGVSLRDGEVHLHARVLAVTASTPLEVAAMAAQVDAPIHRSSLEMLATAEPLGDPWPRRARDALVALLSTGRPALAQIEELDQHGLMSKILPEWEAVRSKPQRNAYHTFTVDRHLCEAAANAAALGSWVRRRDLLLIGTLLHDIGKGVPGDHTEVGMTMVADIGRRMGFVDEDVESLVSMVEHHLLLPDVATRRDLDDPEVIERVAEAIGTVERVHLLHALVVADSKATGPAAWSPWKAELVDTLARRVAHVLGGGSADDTTVRFPDDDLMDRARGGERVIEGVDDALVIIDDDRPGLFARVAGAVALHGLDVVEANIATVEGRAVERLGVHSPLGGAIDWEPVISDILRALDGRLAIRARLAQRAHSYRRVVERPIAAATVHFHTDESSRATVVDVFASNSIGALYRITSALAELDLNLVRARVQTMGESVVDSFYVVDARGEKLTDDLVDEVRVAVLHALEG